MCIATTLYQLFFSDPAHTGPTRHAKSVVSSSGQALASHAFQATLAPMRHDAYRDAYARVC